MNGFIPRSSVASFTRRRRYIAALTTTAAASLYARNWREEKIQSELQEAQTSGAFTTSKSIGAKKHSLGVRRDLEQLTITVQRAGLMGVSVPGAKSVKHELELIRKWHQERGFTGGLVLRELTVPLFDVENEDAVEGGDDVEPIPLHELLQRECYYLYYELCPNGEAVQQIFCRGTTLFADMKTCVNTRMVYDEELSCKLHAGFKRHADRLLDDVLPLLAPTLNKRATIEVCGHSLGGAVAFIVAMKLKKRGYTVKRVTSVAAPRFCEPCASDALQMLLPYDALRIEDDQDIVPYLPPSSRGLGDKLWFTTTTFGREGKAYYVPFQKAKEEDWWIESFLLNTKVLETLSHLNVKHRIPSYVEQMECLANDVNKIENLRTVF